MYKRGFSLIEAVVYIALLGLIMTGAVLVSYQLVASSTGVSAKNTAGEEGNFVLRKINWALSGAQSITAPLGWGSTLSVTRYDGTTVDVRLSGAVIEMRQSGGAYVPLTTTNVTVSSLGFLYIPSVGSSPAGVSASTTLNGMTFYAKRYIRI